MAFMLLSGLFSKIINRSSRIVCNSPRWNQIGQVGDAPGVEVNS